MVLGIGLHSVLTFLIKIVLLTFVIWIVGRSTVGDEKAKFTDAFWIALVGSIVGSLLSQWVPYIGFFIVLILWLALIKHFYDTGWLGALGISIVTVIVWFIIVLALKFLLGFNIAELPHIPQLCILY